MRAILGGFASRTTILIVSVSGLTPPFVIDETLTTDAGLPLLIVEDVLTVGATGALPPLGTRYRTFLFW